MDLAPGLPSTLEHAGEFAAGNLQSMCLTEQLPMQCVLQMRKQCMQKTAKEGQAEQRITGCRD